MDPRNLRLRNSKQAEGVIVAQVAFVREGKLGQIAQILNVVRMNTGCIKSFAIVFNIRVGVVQRRAQPL